MTFEPTDTEQSLRGWIVAVLTDDEVTYARQDQPEPVGDFVDLLIVSITNLGEPETKTTDTPHDEAPDYVGELRRHFEGSVLVRVFGSDHQARAIIWASLKVLRSRVSMCLLPLASYQTRTSSP